MPIIVVLLPFLLAIDCGGDGNGDPTEPTEGITFEDQVACAQNCFSDYREVLEALMHILGRVNDHFYQLPSGISVALDTLHLDFSADLDLDSDGERDALLSGTIRPPPDKRGACSDGMQQHDVCVFEWKVTEMAATDSIAFGTYSAIHLGYTLPPNPRPAHRYTIVDRDTDVIVSDDCGLVIQGFDMMLDASDFEVSSFYLDFVSNYTEGNDKNTLDGWFAWSSGSGDPNAAAVELTVGSQTYDCTFDLDAFGIICP